MAVTAGTHSVQDVVTYVQRQFGDESGVQVTAEDIIRWINQGSMELVSKNPVIQAIAGTAFSEKRQGYPIPDDTIQIQAVVWSKDQAFDVRIFNNADIIFPPVTDSPIGNMIPPSFAGTPLKAVDMSEGLKQRGLLGTGGEPVYWYAWGNTVYLVPQPAEKNFYLRFYYNAAPETVSTLGDLLGIPDRYYDKLLMFVMSKAYELDQDWQAHSTQRDHFEAELRDLNFADLSTQGSYPTIRSVDDGYYY